MSVSNSGHYLEKAVENYLKSIQEPAFTYLRFQDAHSARNFLAKQPADYLVAQNGGVALLECKSVKGTKRRLPKFSQLSDMLRFEMAGVSGYVLVHFYDLDEIFLIRVIVLDPSKPSWVLNGTVYKTVAGAIEDLRERL